MTQPTDEWLLDSYVVQTNGERYHITADPESETYRLEHQNGRFGNTEELGKYANLRDAEQVLVKELENRDLDHLAGEVVDR